jgi:hypothetical protein
MRPLILLVCCCAVSGCVTHRATVETSEDSAGVVGTTYLGEAEHPAGPPTSVTASGPLPQSIPVTAWRWGTAADGSQELRRGDVLVQTPLPWWQRFPADLATDFFPIDAVATTRADVAFIPVSDERREADLTAEAAAAGFPSSPSRGIP